VHTPPAIRVIVRQRVAAVTASVFVAGLLLGISGSAGAAPMPTIAQVQHRLSQLESKVERLDQQFDQVNAELTATDQRLKLINSEVRTNSRHFDAMRREVERIAVTAYEDGNLNSTIVLLLSGRPQQILDQSSLLLELSDINDAQIGQFLDQARQLTTTQELATRTQLSIKDLERSLGKRKATLTKLARQQQALLDKLTPVQRTGTGPGGGGPPGKKPVYHGPTATQAQKAVQYAYAQLNCPYVYGGTGPCRDGFDCSGLTMEAWASAGVSIPRTSYEQWDELPHVSGSLQPGDIMVFNGAGHVGIYVGGNKLIDAPVPGKDVELISFSGWYRQTYDGAVRP
jgi:peptidoglycan DL-endopeptidase CwlO